MIKLLISKVADNSSVENAENLKENSSSLFLKAGKSMNESDRNRDFIVGKDLIERGPFSIISDPTYDLTFQRMFHSEEEGKSRILSLLNSLFYPKRNLDKSDDEMICEVELVNVPISNSKKAVSGMEGQFKQLRCDLLCKCQITTGVNDNHRKISTSYFYIEM